MLKSGLLRASNSLFSPDLHMTLLFCENCSVRLPFYLQSPPSELRHKSMKNLWNFNLWVKLMENSEQWSPDSVQPCPILENAVLCSWAHLVVLLSLPLRSSPQKILRLSDRQTSTSPAHQPSKGDSQRCRWLRPQPCHRYCGYPYIVFMRDSSLHPDAACAHLPELSFLPALLGRFLS